jgi:hypothetical protein
MSWKKGDHGVDRLTTGDNRILQLILDRNSPDQIAQCLGITKSTLDNRVKSICVNLQISQGGHEGRPSRFDKLQSLLTGEKERR